jgi:drug/metabolite transporter (DMT)-like permease
MLIHGVLAAAGAGALWGMVFVTPLILEDYPGALLAIGRYLAFGLVALIPAAVSHRALSALTAADWRRALQLSLVGNLLYYAALATAIQLVGVVLPTLLIGTLPVVIALVSNRGQSAVPWRALAPSLLAIGIGLLLVNASALTGARQGTLSLARWLVGTALALVAVAAWTWYPVMNARYLQANRQIGDATWATAQGLTTLPLALAGLLLLMGAQAMTGLLPGIQLPWGPRPATYIALMLVVGICASWLGTLLWNRASKCLPTALAGQLIVFETIAALVYGFAWMRRWPTLAEALGIGVLIVAVALAVRLFHQHRPRATAARNANLST